VVAYSVGKNLTRYQVTFISIIFILLTLLGTSGQLRNLSVLTEWAEQAVALKSGEAAVSSAQVAISMWLFMGARVALILGALVFMWQARHPKSE
jgi:nitric oxide reductase large subunit